jgi:TRAP-type C4-dicarboxylate transport system permease small subunit
VDRIDRLSRRINAAAEILLAVLGGVMVLVVAAQVFCRYLLNHSLFWSEELARYLLVWLTFLGATVAYRRGLHPSVDFLYARVASGVARMMRLASTLAAMLLFGVMTVGGTQFAHFIRTQISPALQVPKWTVMLVVPLSGALLILHTLALSAKRPEGAPRDD